jgi:adenosylmethionine-8-amino-7-oxononanoate aminotransferase
MSPAHPPAFLHPFSRPAAEDFTTIVGGAGAEVWDKDGRRFIDGMASLWYCNVGYGRVEIADAVHKQMTELAAFSCFDPFTNEPADALASIVADLAPVPESRVFFTSSGSEAVDSAIKLARIAHVRAGRPERTVILSRGRAYHGVTYGGTSAQGLPLNREGFGPYVEGVVNLPADDIEAWAGYLAEHGAEVAAILTEPVQGAGGVYPPPEGFLDGLRRLADRHGCFLIFDEVITGFGRLGDWFAGTHYDVRADLTTFAKAITSGYVPLGGVLVAPSVREPLEADRAWLLRHGHTYSGHPTACAAALANLAILRDEELLERVPAISERLFGGFHALAADGQVAEVRATAAIGALKLLPEHDAFAVRAALMEAGVITRAVNAETLTWCPPLVITDAQIDRIVDAVADALR